MTDTLTPSDQLAQAQAALHAVLIGRQSVEIMVDGRTVKYGPANINQLKAYVAQLAGGEITTVRISSNKGLR